MATFRHNTANLISVPLTFMNLLLKKVIYPRNLFFSPIERFSPNVVVDLDRKSELRFGKKISAHSGCRLTANNGGRLTVDDHTSFNVGCIVTCRNKISVGKNVAFGPNVMIYDHNHILDRMNGATTSDYSLGVIEIGDNTWIGANTVILSNTRIGKNCVIAAGSVVKGDVPDNTVLIQKRTNTYKRIEV